MDWKCAWEPTLAVVYIFCRCRKEIENFKDDNRRLKQTNNIVSKETEDLKKDIERLERRIENLVKFEDECHRLQEENSNLMKDSRALQEQFESVIIEKENLEFQTQETLEALNEERETRSLLEMKMKEESYSMPTHLSWAEENRSGERLVNQSDNKGKVDSSSLDEKEEVRSLSSPLPPVEAFDAKIHSTPYPSKNPPQSLLSEIQSSFMSDEQKKELETLHKKIVELEEAMGSLQREKKVLEQNIMVSSVRETEQLKELEEFRDKYAKNVCEKDKTIDDLNQRIIIRDEQIEQLRTKLSVVTSEKTSLEIEVDGLNSEIQRLKVISGLEMDKIQREQAQEQTKAIELKSQIVILEEQVSGYISAVEKLENIVYNSQSEVGSMIEDIKNLQKVIVTLGTEGKFSPTSAKVNKHEAVFHMMEEKGTLKDDTSEGTEVGTTEMVTNGEVEEDVSESCYYSLKLKQKKLSVQVHNENHSLRAIINLREQLKLVRSPLEQFTKVMLERSLIHSSKNSSLPSSPDQIGTSRKNTLDLEAAISKWKSKFMHKTEEIANLRSIMKARATTAEVATSSLRSKLEGQARAYQTELTKLKYQIKILKKERDEHLSLRTMYAKRCEDYIDEITNSKRVIEKQKQDYDELMISLEKTIQRKLELSTELEEYKMEQERIEVIPRVLCSTRV